MKKLILSLFVLGLILTSSPTAMAMVMPPFSSCLNPQGTLKAQYDSGIHGIVGDSRTYTGKDAVYFVDQDNLLQCFCDTNGNGIQTKWLKASSFTDPDLKLLQAQGWVPVQDGSLWGLLAEKYLAKNETYVCGGKGGLQGEVMGLAGTGNMSAIMALLSIGTVALISSVLLSKRVNS